MIDVLASRRAIFALVALLALSGALLGLNHLLRHPSETEAAEIVYGDLLRYETLHGDPHVVFRQDNLVRFDELKRDYKYIIAKGSAGWVLSGKWYTIPTTYRPASIAVARCTGVVGEVCGKETELFGEVKAPEIETLEVEYDAEWLSFAVEPPGYAIRLEDRYEAPTAYRWLDADGDVLHEQGYVEPLDPLRMLEDHSDT